MKNPKISIVVPVYNTAEYLCECLDCFMAQTYDNFEVLLVDDGSTDNSGIICDNYVAKDNRFRVIHKKNMGVSAARNSGIDVALGEYIGFVDSDDTFLPAMLSEYASIALRTNADIISSISCLDDNSLAKYTGKPFLHIFNNKEARNEFFKIGEVRPSVWLTIIKKDLIASFRFPSHIVQWEDYAFIGLMISRASVVAITSKLFYKYRYREGSATKQSLNDKHLTCLLIDDFFKENHVYQSKQEHHDVVGFFVRCCALGYLGCPELVKEKYRENIRKTIKENICSLFKCRSVSLNMKIIISNILLSERVSEMALNIKYKAIQGILNIRNRLVSRG